MTLIFFLEGQSITSFSSCIHAFQDLDLYNNVLTPCS